MLRGLFSILWSSKFYKKKINHVLRIGSDFKKMDAEMAEHKETLSFF